jgi:hypothetical protein
VLSWLVAGATIFSWEPAFVFIAASWNALAFAYNWVEELVF